MSTYYEVLGIPFTATVAEIEVAYETQYNRWRRLVTHHDPEMVNRANQALRWLEKAHVTLTDPAKRAAYDAGIGPSGPVGGLADPQAKPQKERPTPPPPGQCAEPQVPPAAAERVDAWACPRCQTPNPLGTHYCNRCGQQVGLECPKCGKLTQVAAPYCSECGVNIEEETHRQQAEREAWRRRQEQQRLCTLQEELQGQYAAVQALEHIRQKRVSWPRVFGIGGSQPEEELWLSVGDWIRAFSVAFVWIGCWPLGFVGIALLGSVVLGTTFVYWEVFSFPLSVVVAVSVLAFLRRFVMTAPIKKALQINRENIASLQKQIEQIQNRKH